jgi:hypothetical protein
VAFSNGQHPPGAGVNRIRHGGRMAQDAKATGKASGDADGSPDVWTIEGRVGVEQ